MEYKLLIDGQWVNAGSLMEVKNKYNGAVIAALPTARKEDVDAAIAAAERAEDVMADMPAYKRADILLKAAALMRERADDLAKTIAAEAGKALKFARAEVDRAQSTFTIAAEEAKRLHGETIPLDAVPAGEVQRTERKRKFISIKWRIISIAWRRGAARQSSLRPLSLP